MLTRWIQRTEPVPEGSIEYEYRDAEYEYEKIARTNMLSIRCDDRVKLYCLLVHSKKRLRVHDGPQ